MGGEPLNDWPCLDAARACRTARVPVRLGRALLGSVDTVGSAALAAWPRWFEHASDGWHLTIHAAERDAALAEVHAALRAQGLIRAWRDEPFVWWADDGSPAAVIERAATRFWGALTLGAHANGLVTDASGHPTHLWIARRAWNKPTDPGRLDNLIGAGVPRGQTPLQALQREAWEEAGLQVAELSGLRRGRVVELDCDIPEGRQHECLFVYDLALPPGRVPQNQDGEVGEHRLMPVDEALARAAAGELTTDAALATLDLALRHQLLPPAQAARLGPRFEALCVAPHRAAAFDPPVG